MFVVAIAIASLENDTVGDHFRQKIVEENPSTFSGLESSKRKPRSLLRNYGVYLVVQRRLVSNLLSKLLSNAWGW